MSAEVFQTSDLALANLGVVHCKNLDGILVLQTELVDTDDLLDAGIDAGLLAGSCFLDAEFRNTGLDGLCHTAELLDFLDVLPGSVNQIVGEALYIVAACPRIDVLAD